MCAHLPSRVGIPILQLDAFADAPFTGTPAAVCLPDVEPPAGWMQQVAAGVSQKKKEKMDQKEKWRRIPAIFIFPAAAGRCDRR